MIPRGESGAGSVLGVAVTGSVLAALTLVIPLYLGLGIRESVADAADAAALAAGDVAAGITPGVPCTIAASVAAANRASLDACAIDGLVVTVRTSVGFLGFTLTSTASAGPPVAVSN